MIRVVFARSDDFGISIGLVSAVKTPNFYVQTTKLEICLIKGY